MNRMTCQTRDCSLKVGAWAWVWMGACVLYAPLLVLSCTPLALPPYVLGVQILCFRGPEPMETAFKESVACCGGRMRVAITQTSIEVGILPKPLRCADYCSAGRFIRMRC